MSVEVKMAERTFLHVGTPKSGTAFLHAVLWHNADALRHHGLLLPGRMVAHYAAARAVTSRHDAPSPASAPDHQGSLGSATTAPTAATSAEADNGWARIVRQSNRWPGSTLIGHPQLASATPAQVSGALGSIDGDVHVVITARALHLQPALSWQDQVKHGLSVTLDAFLAGLRDDGRSRSRRFWRVHDIADIACRWAGDLVPAHRVHVVPVTPLADSAPGGSDVVGSTSSGPAALWSRYAGALGLDDPSAYDSDLPVRTLPLGPAELELLRRVNARHDPRFTDPQRHVWTRQLLANSILARRPAAPLQLPDDTLAWLSERSDAILARIRAAGYDVAGDLADLDTAETDPRARPAADVTDDEVETLAAWTILRLQEELVHREPVVAPPPVGPEDGIDAVLELLEHIRAADTATRPRPAPPRDDSRVARLRRALPVRRSR